MKQNKQKTPNYDAQICVFNTFQSWVNHASSWLRGYKSKQLICLDIQKRICEIGSDFMRADNENTFPVTVYEVAKEEKLYFESIDHNICYPLEDLLTDAKSEEKKTITLIEAVLDKVSDFVWCSLDCASVARCYCCKKECDYYEKSGNNVCVNRGKLYSFGEEVTFDVSTGKKITSN